MTHVFPGRLTTKFTLSSSLEPLLSILTKLRHNLFKGILQCYSENIEVSFENKSNRAQLFVRNKCMFLCMDGSLALWSPSQLFMILDLISTDIILHSLNFSTVLGGRRCWRRGIRNRHHRWYENCWERWRKQTKAKTSEESRLIFKDFSFFF